MLKQFNGQEISFFDWCAAALPVAVSLIVVEYLLIVKTFKLDTRDIQPAVALIEQKITTMGKVSKTERRIGLLMLGTILAWMFLGERIGLADISMIAAVALFVFGLVRWRDVEDYVNWGIILMYGGAMALGGALAKSGAAEWLVSAWIDNYSPQPILVVAFIAIAAMLLTAVMNNSATVAVLLPIAFSLSRQYGIDPTVMVFAVAIPAGLDFCLPVGTPANAICYSSGYYRVNEMARVGLLLNIAALAIVVIVGYFYWPLIGMNIR
jgi:sodium-dependent dicarboxylate transporter 2/3/5